MAVLNPAALQCLHFHVLVGEFVGVLVFEMPAEILGVEKLDGTLYCKSCSEVIHFQKKKKEPSGRGCVELCSAAVFALSCSRW